MDFGEYSALVDSCLHYLKCPLLVGFPSQKTQIGTLYLSHRGSLEHLKITTYTNLSDFMYPVFALAKPIKYEYHIF